IELATLNAEAKRAPVSDNLWDLRDRLPADVLREIEIEETSTPQAAGNRVRLNNTLAGQVSAVGDLATSDSAVSRTALDVHGGLPNGWKYDLRGDYSALTDPSGNTNILSDNSGTTTGNAAGLALDVATSPLDVLTLQTRRNTLSFHDEGPASLETHGVSWSRGAEEGTVESVAARYIEEDNLYRATSFGTSFTPIASRTWEVRANYSRPAGDSAGVAVSMTYRHRDAMTGPSGVSSDGTFIVSAPDADLSASTSTKLSGRSEVEGGVVARYLGGGYGIAPMAAARYDLGAGNTVYVKGLIRARESTVIANGTTMPLVTSIHDQNDATARKELAVGIQRQAGNDGSYVLEVSSQRVGETVRAFFEGDFLTDFDSVYFFDGNLIRQYRGALTHRLSDKLSGTVNALYGQIGGDVAAPSAAAYGISSNSGHYWSASASVEVIPTKTGVALLFHGSRQTLDTSAAVHANDSSKITLSLSQDLSVVGVSPFGSVCRLLVAVESGRSTATGDREDAPMTRRVLGGVAVSF
ncbi:MAG TPA: hypothetical protein VEG84_06415, partial [Thermoanaerobaculia bacterium]|nr:hypothetical protein [Thermoanaerobaculia bacterium]